MRRRTIIIPLLLIFATAIGLSLRNYHPEPEYQNHPLSYWLDRSRTEISTPLRYKAIESIGTNAIPIYTIWSHANDSILKMQLMRLLEPLNIHMRSAYDYQQMGEFGWQIAQLSHEVVNPIVWEKFSRHDSEGYGAILTVGEERDCIDSLQHGTPEQREGAARIISRYTQWPEPSKALISALKDNSPRVRYFAARSLALSNENSQSALPALIQSLQDENEFVRMTAAFALGKFGKAAARARTALVPLLNDPNADVRACAILALQQTATSTQRQD
jgi:HEAT repeats